MLNSLIGKHSHKLELGIGQGLTVTTKGSFFLLTIPTIGYRYQNETKNMFYRVTYTPLISYLFDFQMQQWAGISIGYTLNNKAECRINLLSAFSYSYAVLVTKNAFLMVRISITMILNLILN